MAKAHQVSRRTVASIFARTAIAAALALPAVAAAAPQRTFVASSGDDSNPCTLAQPCRGFTAALAAVNSGGEILVLDSAGYGPVTIDKSVSIVAAPGAYAGITVSSGNGITIATAGIDVRLKGLTINGLGGTYGVHVTAGNSLRIEDCAIANISWGVRVDGPMLLMVSNTRFDHDGGAGIWVQDGTTVSVTDSEFTQANQGLNVLVTTTPSTTRVSVARSTFTRVYTALHALGAPTTGNIYASISDSTFTGDYTAGSG